MGFLIPLTIFLASRYIYKHSSGEICYLFAVITGVSLLISVIIAPWQIQVLLLSAGLFYVNRALQTPGSTIESSENSQQGFRKTTHQAEAVNQPGSFSGQELVNYNSSEHCETKLTYRGASYQPASSCPGVVSQPNLNLKYRGCSCVNSSNSQALLQEVRSEEPEIGMQGG